jgi:hypothetical protein
VFLMAEGLLHPRLPPAVARRRFQELQRLPASLLPSEVRNHAPDAVFAALGGVQVSERQLDDLRDALVAVAERAGYPDARGTRASRERFDLDCAAVLRDRLQIVAAEAAAIDVWAFLGVMLLPDLCFWRFPDPPEDRVIGPDLTRHTFARLWWRAYQLADLEPSSGLTALQAIPENVMNQIFERRAIGGNRELVRGVARALIAAEDQWAEIPRRRLVRDGVRRLRRLMAFTSPEALDEATLRTLIEQVFEETASALLAAPPGTSEPTEEDTDTDTEVRTPQTDVPPSRSHAEQGLVDVDFDHAALAEIPAQIATLINELGGVSDDDLPAAFERRYGIHVPTDEHQLLHRFAWSAKGRRFIELDEENNIWMPGSKAPAPVEQLGDWTISLVYNRATALLVAQPGVDPFEQLVHEVYKDDGERVPRLIMSLVGKILNKARRDLNGGNPGARRRGA